MSDVYLALPPWTSASGAPQPTLRQPTTRVATTPSPQPTQPLRHHVQLQDQEARFQTSSRSIRYNSVYYLFKLPALTLCVNSHTAAIHTLQHITQRSLTEEDVRTCFGARSGPTNLNDTTNTTNNSTDRHDPHTTSQKGSHNILIKHHRRQNMSIQQRRKHHVRRRVRQAMRRRQR